MRRKCVSMLLAIVMALSLLPGTAWAAKEDVIVYPVTGGDIYIRFDSEGDACYVSDCDDTVTEANIPSQVDGCAIESIVEYAFDDCADLTKVTFPDTLITIGQDAFANCTSLTSVSLPSSLIYIGGWAFESCAALASVTIPASVKEMDTNPFYGCNRLKEIKVAVDNPNYAAENGALFSKDKTSLISYPTATGTYKVPDGVKSIEHGAFYNCAGLTSVTLPDSLITVGGWAFEDCSGLTGMSLPNSVTSIKEGAFRNCTGLRSLNIPDSVTSIGNGAFYNCTSLRSLSVPTSVTSIGDSVFYNCTSLTSVTLPDSLTSISDYTFCYCTGLTSVTLPDSLTSIGDGAFASCTNLTSVALPDTLTSIGDSAFAYCDSLTDVTLPDSLTSIGDSVFAYCDNLTGVTFPDTLTSIGDSAFAYCDGVTDVTLPSSLASLGDGAFQGLTGLTAITIPAGLTEIVGNPFAVCPNLKEITVAADNPKYTAENGVLFNKDKTKIVAYPSATGAYSIPDGVKFVGSWAFQETALTSVTIPVSVLTIGEGAFYDCDSLKDVYYTDTEARWKAMVEIDHNEDDSDNEDYEDYNAPLAAATIHYNSTGPDAADTSTTPSTPSTPAASFTDVKPGAYYAAPVAWAVEQEITSGTGNNQFSPNLTCDVSQILTFLWRAAGKPEPTIDNPFTDVKESSFYYKPALWAYEKGMVTGSTFNPTAVCTRAMAVTFIWQASDSPAADPASFTDVPADSSYAAAVAWAVANGVTEGVGNGQFNPSGTCTRGQIVTFLYRAFAE